MGKLYKNKYRVNTIRHPGWDYSWDGLYFVTICTHNNISSLGRIINDVFEPSLIGRIIYQCWAAIPSHYPFVYLQAFTVMPNHIHGIIEIRGNRISTVDHFVYRDENKTQNTFGRQSNNLGAVIRGFKIGVKKEAKEKNIDFKWQKSYFDRIIRDGDELTKIREYIIGNQENWHKDNFYSNESVEPDQHLAK